MNVCDRISFKNNIVYPVRVPNVELTTTKSRVNNQVPSVKNHLQLSNILKYYVLHYFFNPLVNLQHEQCSPIMEYITHISQFSPVNRKHTVQLCSRFPEQITGTKANYLRLSIFFVNQTLNLKSVVVYVTVCR